MREERLERRGRRWARRAARPHDVEPSGRHLAALSLTALGVVYGDIGTSPLYAFRECFNPEHGLQPVPATVYGVAMGLGEFIEEVERSRPVRVPGTAVFLTPNVAGVPRVLLLHYRHNKVLHEELILLAIVTEQVPEVRDDERLVVEHLPQGFHRVRARYGFMEAPDVKDIVARCCGLGFRATPERTTYFLGRARLLPTGPAPMMRWRKRLYAFMARNASAATDFFRLPPERVIELGAQIEF